LTHDSLPGGGPGRSRMVYATDQGRVVGASAGLFELKRWDLTTKGLDGTDSPRPLRFRAAWADHSMNNAPLALQGEWNISWEGGKNHTSVWSLLGPVTLKAGTKLHSQMHFNPFPGWADQNLGRFRVSVSSAPAPFDREQKRSAVRKLTDPRLRLSAAYALI